MIELASRAALRNPPDAFNHLTGQSPALREAIAIARAVAHVDSTILITGESGVGKEFDRSGYSRNVARAEAPFIAINCATLTEALQNSELFGHVKGAFTGALRDKAGLFETAQGGTLLLDEVAELAPSAQAALLRALQERVVMRLGSIAPAGLTCGFWPLPIAIWTQRWKPGAFRTDLFFRLNVVNIHLPALRERDHDVLLLADQLIRNITSG